MALGAKKRQRTSDVRRCAVAVRTMRTITIVSRIAHASSTFSTNRIESNWVKLSNTLKVRSTRLIWREGKIKRELFILLPFIGSTFLVVLLSQIPVNNTCQKEEKRSWLTTNMKVWEARKENPSNKQLEEDFWDKRIGQIEQDAIQCDKKRRVNTEIKSKAY